MPKLKALRGSIGIYGRVKANGIVEVDEVHVDKLLKSNRFVRATAADIAAAEEAQKAFLAVGMTGATPGFAPVAVAGDKGRLAALIDSGAISKAKAQELVALQIEISDDELRDALQSVISEKEAELAARETVVTEREVDLSAREAAHVDIVAAHEAEASRLAALAADLEAREAALKASGHPPAQDAPPAEDGGAAKGEAKGKAAK